MSIPGEAPAQPHPSACPPTRAHDPPPTRRAVGDLLADAGLGATRVPRRALVVMSVLSLGMYLVSITLGLATIIHVLRYQAQRVRRLPDEPAHL